MKNRVITFISIFFISVIVVPKIFSQETNSTPVIIEDLVVMQRPTIPEMENHNPGNIVTVINTGGKVVEVIVKIYGIDKEGDRSVSALNKDLRLA
jgi:hypothetical protein